jgi:phosphomannomutase/phosphoglucomutase
MNPNMFREYDLRGVFGRDYDLADVTRIGRGYGAFLADRGGRTMALGRDCRLSSPDVRDAFVDGLVSTGLDVIDVGLCPTPVLYFAQHHLKTDGAVMITASHNPPEYNGFKVCVGPDPIFGADIQALRQVIESGNFPSGRGTARLYNILDPYIDFVAGGIHLERPVRVALDAGNATGGLAAGPLMDRLGCPYTPLFFDLDGRFPNHMPDPTLPENMTTLARTVVRDGLELGIGFDGDADRIGVVDETGRLILGDMLLLIFARDILAANPGAAIVAEVKTSQNFFNDIAARGGRPIMNAAGHSLVRNRLKREQALLAGEVSGHIFFRHRYLGFDDALYSACRLLEIVSRRPESVSQYLADLPPTFHTPEIRVDCPDEIKFPLAAWVRDELKKTYDVIDVDGARVVFPDGWGLVRASNTGPILVLRFEAQTENRLKEIRDLVESVVERGKAAL